MLIFKEFWLAKILLDYLFKIKEAIPVKEWLHGFYLAASAFRFAALGLARKHRHAVDARFALFESG